MPDLALSACGDGAPVHDPAMPALIPTEHHGAVTWLGREVQVIEAGAITWAEREGMSRLGKRRRLRVPDQRAWARDG